MTATHLTPVTHRSFLCVQLGTTPTSPKAPQIVLSVSNPPLDGFLSRPSCAATGTAARSPASPPRPAGTDGVPDEGDWKSFVDHLRQQGTVPGAGPDDPEQGVVTPANVSVRQMLAFLGNQAPVAAADAGTAAGARSAVAETPAAAPTSARYDAAPPCEDPPLREDELALDDELRMWAETYRPQTADLPTMDEDHEEEDVDVMETFGTTPKAELAALRRAALVRANAALVEDDAPEGRAPGHPVSVTFDACGTVREYALGAEPNAVGLVPELLFLTKMHDGKWRQEPLDVPFMPLQAVTPDDDDEFVVHMPQHRDRSAAPTHAEHLQDQSFWTDLGRDDEPAAAVGYLQRLQQLQAEVDESLRRNQQMSEDIGVYF